MSLYPTSWNDTGDISESTVHLSAASAVKLGGGEEDMLSPQAKAYF